MKDNERYLELKKLTNGFLDFARTKNYSLEPSVKITSGLDPSVKFIGAPISLLKPYFMSNTISDSGIAMRQNCVRTRNHKILFEPSILPNWGSFFTGMCILVKYGDLKKICLDAIDLLINQFGIKKEDINIQINSEDTDLLEAINATTLDKEQILFNKKPNTYYRHKYGIDEVRGRNFNFSIRNLKTGLFDDIGNIIVIETMNGKKLGVELALGDTTILKQQYGLNHVLDNYCLGLESINDEYIRYRIEDAIITSIVLISEGLKPSGTETRGRILKSYLKSLSLYTYLANLNDSVLLETIKSAETAKLPIDNADTSSDIMKYVSKYRKDMLKKQTGKENEKIYRMRFKTFATLREEFLN